MIAVPVTAYTLKDAFEMIAEANIEADIIELRLDYLPRLGEKDLKQLLQKCEKPVICTCRKKDEGGLFEGTESTRLGVLKKCVNLGCEYIDLEFELSPANKKKMREFLKGKKVKLILSKHFFGYTPEFEELEKLLEKMVKENPYAIKIVSKANGHEDNKIMFQLLKKAKMKGVRIIAFCMGNSGKDSRILSMPLGSYLTFACLDSGKGSAEGQMPVKELKKIYSGLRVMF